MKKLFDDDFLNMSIKLLDDNQRFFDLIKNPKHHSRTKHINVQYHYIKKMMEDGLMRPGYVSIKKMIADMLTKPTKPTIFLMLRRKLSLTEIDF